MDSASSGRAMQEGRREATKVESFALCVRLRHHTFSFRLRFKIIA